jgi:hypothetical protein
MTWFGPKILIFPDKYSDQKPEFIIAHFLEYDLVTQGKTAEEALERLSIMFYQQREDNKGGEYVPPRKAPGFYYEMFEKGHPCDLKIPDPDSIFTAGIQIRRNEFVKNNLGCHAGHCCTEHGCKYGNEHCPVVTKLVEGGRCYDCYEFDRERDEACEDFGFDKEITKAHFDGMREAVQKYAWWKDGEQFVGCGAQTLKEALEEIDKKEAKCL